MLSRRPETRPDLFRAWRLFLDGYDGVVPLEPLERAILADSIAARTAMMVTLSAWQAAGHPNSPNYFAAWEAAAWNIMQQIDDLGSDAVSAELGVTATPALEDILQRRKPVFGSALVSLTYDQPVYLEAGRDAELTEVGGRVLIDAYNNIPVQGLWASAGGSRHR